MTSPLEIISQDLSVDKARLAEVLRTGKLRCKKIYIPKKTGGTREITQTTPENKMIQYWLIENLFSKFPHSPTATAFHKETSILENARRHSNARYSIRIDLKDFFQSIKLIDIKVKILDYSTSLPKWAQDKELIDIIDNSCFDKNLRLPIGYPSSPIISNIAMLDIDKKIIDHVNSNYENPGSCNITRYADDFIFSTNKNGECKKFLEFLTNLISTESHPKLSINHKKTRYMSKAGGSTLITGLRVNYDGRIKVHPNYRDHVRLLLKLYSNDKLNTNEYSSLIGHLSYVQNIDPEFFTKLSHRYFIEINKIRGIASEKTS